MKLHLAIIALLLSTCCGRGLAQAQAQVQVQAQVQSQPTASASQPGVVTLTASARAVLLDVVATDQLGNPLPGLTAADFAVTEDGSPQTIASFEAHHPAAVTPHQAVAPNLPINTFASGYAQPPASGTTVVLLDMLDTPPEAQAFARTALIKYVKSMPPGAGLALFQLDTSLHLIQSYTEDPAVLLNAIDDRERVGRTVLPLNQGFVAARLRMDALTSGMQELGGYLQTLPGRKNLVWFTAAIPRAAYDDGSASGGTLHDSMSFDFDYAQTAEIMRLGRVAIYPVDVRGLETDPTFSASQRGAGSFFSSRNFVTRRFFEHSQLDEVAEATGGTAFYNSNGLSTVLRDVVEAASTYYTLSYYPINRNWNGDRRQVRIRLTSSAATLAYRRGYYAVTDSRLPRHAATAQAAFRRVPLVTPTAIARHDAFLQTMHLGAVDPGDVRFQVSVNTATAANLPAGAPALKSSHLTAKFSGKPRRVFDLKFLVHGDQLNLALTPDGRRVGKVEFIALLYDDQGELVNESSMAIDMKLLDDTYQRATRAGLTFPMQLEVPAKGTYFLHLGVHDLVNGKGGTLELATSRVQPDIH